MHRQIHYRRLNTDYGSYFPGFFVMRLNKVIKEIDGKMTFSDFTKEEFATFVHEYVHYLQDISTTRGINGFVYVSKLLQLHFNIAATKFNEGVIYLPLDIENLDVDNLYQATELESLYQGTEDMFLKIHHADCVKREIEECLEGIISEKIYNINVYYDDKNIPYMLGQAAVSESMAYTIEHEAFGAEARVNEFPYNACELVCRQIYPQLLFNKAVFVAAMELSLMHYHSGDMFCFILSHMKDNNLCFNTVSEFENYFAEKTSHLLEDMSKEFQEAEECIKFLYPLNVDPVFDKTRDFVKKKLQAGLLSRKKDGLFIARMLESKIPQQTLSDYIYKYGMPIMCDSAYAMYGTELDGSITALLAPLALYDVFQRTNECFMYPYCKASNMEVCNCDECKNHPWTQADKKSGRCFFGVYWYMYSLAGKKIVRKSKNAG